MDALVITLREGLEAALVIGIIYALVKRAGRSDLMRWVIAGAVSAGVFSVGVAVGLGALGLSAENPIVEGVTYLVAGVAVASMVVWMWRNGRSIRSKVQCDGTSRLSRAPFTVTVIACVPIVASSSTA